MKALGKFHKLFICGFEKAFGQLCTHCIQAGVQESYESRFFQKTPTRSFPG